MLYNNGLYISDIVIILSKDALFSEESNFLEGFEENKTIQNSNIEKCCSGIIVSLKDTEILRLSGSSPAKLNRRIKAGRLFLK